MRSTCPSPPSSRNVRAARKDPRPNHLNPRYSTIRADRAGPPSRLLLGRPLFVVFLVELLARHLLLGDIRKLDQEVDHLFLIDRRAQAGDGLRIVPVILPDLLFLAGELAR